MLGSERAWVVHGADGLDEISTTGYTKVSECRSRTVNTFYLHPAEVGLPKGTLDQLKGGDAATNAAIVTGVLGGGRGPAREIVLINAAAVLFLAGKVDRLRDGLALAASALDSGAAARTLARLADASRARAEG